MTNVVVSIPDGTYIVAVSGGVDSVVLLDILTHTNNKLIVAHFDHGIRHNSTDDARFVKKIAEAHNLDYEEEQGELGESASEAEAREARYKFLESIKKKYNAHAVVTAHHQDDVIETSIINILRGTGRHGLTSLKNQAEILRPLIGYPKSELIKYAKESKLTWVEDITNADTKYLRNKVRLEIVPKMTSEQRAQWLEIIAKTQQINQKLDNEINSVVKRGLHKGRPVLNRQWFTMLPHIVAKEVLLAILRSLNTQDIDRKTIERLTVQIKTVQHGKVLEASGVRIFLTKRSARFEPR